MAKINYERGSWQYQNDRPDCKKCGRKACYHHKETDGSVQHWRSYCRMCVKDTYNNAKYAYRLYKGKSCGKCGFTAVHPTQLDVDHIDGDHSNNQLSNLQTICANCHRLKTVMNGDHNGIKYVPNNTKGTLNV